MENLPVSLEEIKSISDEVAILKQNVNTNESQIILDRKLNEVNKLMNKLSEYNCKEARIRYLTLKQLKEK